MKEIFKSRTLNKKEFRKYEKRSNLRDHGTKWNDFKQFSGWPCSYFAWGSNAIVAQVDNVIKRTIHINSLFPRSLRDFFWVPKGPQVIVKFMKLKRFVVLISFCWEISKPNAFVEAIFLQGCSQILRSCNHIVTSTTRFQIQTLHFPFQHGFNFIQHHFKFW